MGRGTHIFRGFYVFLWGALSMAYTLPRYREWHRIFKIERGILFHLIQPLLKQGHWENKLPMNTAGNKISKEGNFTVSPDSPFHCSVTWIAWVHIKQEYLNLQQRCMQLAGHAVPGREGAHVIKKYFYGIRISWDYL